MHALVRGRISVNPRGFGFLNIEASPEKGGAPGKSGGAALGPVTAFVTPPDLNPFLDGDVVDAAVVEAEPGRYSASQLLLVHRDRTELFGTVVSHAKRPHLRVDRLVSNTDWPFKPGSADDLAEGTAVVAAIDGAAVVPARVVAPGADLGIERCLARNGVRAVFPGEVLEASRAAAAAVSIERELARGRRDLRELTTVTIDAPVTTDIDDAVAVLPAGPDGALRVFVSIADVDALVPEGSPLDLEARARGTSVYLAGRVIPMVPEAISSEAASLLPAVDRLAVTVELRVDPEGCVTSIDLHESVIRSHARLSYDAVEEFLTTGRSAGVPEAVEPVVRWLRTAAARLSTVRAARGGVELDRDEAYVTLDAETREPTGVSPRSDTDAHRLIERLMVAANEAVATWLVARGLPSVYRVHDEPTEERVRTLEQFAHNFGIEAGFGPRLSPRGLAAFEAQFRGSGLAPAIRTVLGKALGPARYTAEPGLHFGLGAPLYLHFTSPIRRYADLAVHRVVKRYLQGHRDQLVDAEALASLSHHLNARARSAGKAETERHRMLVARLFASRIGEEIEGNIVAIKPFGLVVQMAESGATGTIALEALPGGPYRLDVAAQALIGAERRYGVGEPIRAAIASTNEELGRVDLTLAGARGAP
ncbi:RNB domain-containing ribonuclease [Sorangium sp. So ce291]|uniref:ribonuclease R family protein n=1 Tax=Sorangium sp. So ce291 TaxID=3133294 RepID=UPI003F5EE8CE